MKYDGGSLWTCESGPDDVPAVLLCSGGPGCCDYLEPVAKMIDNIWPDNAEKLCDELREFLTGSKRLPISRIAEVIIHYSGVECKNDKKRVK